MVTYDYASSLVVPCLGVPHANASDAKKPGTSPDMDIVTMVDIFLPLSRVGS